MKPRELTKEERLACVRLEQFFDETGKTFEEVCRHRDKHEALFTAWKDLGFYPVKVLKGVRAEYG